MNRFASRVKSLVQTIVLVLIFVGCGGTPIDGFKGERGQVSGKITLGGEPVQAGCQVYLWFIGEMRAETQFESSTGNTTIWIFEA